MKPLAIFYHCRLTAHGDQPINLDHSVNVMFNQMGALKRSGLEDAAKDIFIGVNGSSEDVAVAAMLAPSKATMLDHPANAVGLHPTVRFMRQWCVEHPDAYVCFHHSKAACHPGDEFYAAWRRCMEGVVIHRWQQCVKDLDNGFDSVGAHWLTPERFGVGQVKSPFWGGMFFWATAKFLATLPEVPPTANNRDEMFYTESWIGIGPRRPRVMDYEPHWPGPDCHSHAPVQL